MYKYIHVDFRAIITVAGVLCCGIVVRGSLQSGIFTKFTLNQEITSHHLYNVQVASKLECAVHCLKDIRCYAIVTDCTSLKVTPSATCELKKEPTLATPYTIISTSHCYASLLSRSNEHSNGNYFNVITQATNDDVTTTQEITTSATTTEESTTASSGGGYVVSMLGNFEHHCSGSSGKDIAIITTDGVYVYDDKDALSTGPCLGPIAFETLFPGYTGDRPTVDQIDCALAQDSRIEVYASGRVWSWQSNSGHLQVRSSFPISISSHFSQSGAKPSSPDWCSYRKIATMDRIFYENSAFIMRSDQNPYARTYTKSQDVINQNNYELNVFKSLPSNTVTLTYIDNGFRMYIVITSDLKYHEYAVDQNTNVHDPPVTITEIGPVKFS